MRTLRRIEDAVVRAERALLVGLLLFMVALSFVQVVLRGAFSSGLLWGDTLLRHLVLWVGFIGAALATVNRRQFAMDAFVRMLPAPRRRWVRLAVDLVSAAACAFLLAAAWRFLADERAAGEALFSVGGLTVRAWALEAILPAGFALLLFHSAVRAAEELTGTAPPDAPMEGL